jgi:hypothetical protein
MQLEIGELIKKKLGNGIQKKRTDTILKITLVFSIFTISICKIQTTIFEGL